MMYSIIFNFILSLVSSFIMYYILNDTHVEYYDKFDYMEEFDLGVTTGKLFLIICIELIPILNIFLFVTFLISYFIFFMNAKPTGYKDTYIFYLKGDNFMGRMLNKIIKK